MANSVVFCDYETYSACEIKFGAFRYAQDPSTEIISLAYSFDMVEFKLWYPGLPAPQDFLDHIKEGGLVRSWNFGFEYAITNYVGARLHGWPMLEIKQGRCTQADALALSLPAGLDMCGTALSLSVLKDKNGKRLITKLCKPRKPTKNLPHTRITKDIDPEAFEEFYSYNIDDVKAEVAIFNALPRQIKGRELDLFHLTLKINERGIPVDMPLVNAILKAKSEYEIRLNKEIETITGGQLVSTGSRPKSLAWLEENGLKLDGYTKADIQAALNTEDISDEVRRFLEIRSELSRTPIKKFDFLAKAVCSDGTLKNNIIYHKATTGRFAGSGFQIHNLTRDSSEDTEELVSKFLTGKGLSSLNIYNEAIKLTRSVLHAPIGMKLVVSDFSSIENRIAAWLSGDYSTLDDFIQGLDQYKVAAASIYNVDYDAVLKEQRQLGKISVLSCIFGGGWKTFKTVCETSWGITVTDEQAQDIVEGYRAKYYKMKLMWYGLYDAALECVATKSITKFKHIKFRIMGDFLYMRLPSGRLIAYYKPELRKVMTPWGQQKIALTHMGQNTYTRKWERLTVIPGRLTENAVQATARDALTDSMFRVEEAGYDLIGCVHDENISLVPKDFGSLEEYDNIMRQVPHWAPECPIEVEGYEARRYRK